jgi:recombinational DNA repair ATPase RecF
MENQNAYQQKRAAQLKEWGAQIDLWEAKLETTSADLKIKRAEQIQALRAQQRSATEKMQELGKSGGAAWGQLKITADKIWDDLKSGVADAHSKFK